jgi:hypothetical protein
LFEVNRTANEISLYSFSETQKSKGSQTARDYGGGNHGGTGADSKFSPLKTASNLNDKDKFQRPVRSAVIRNSDSPELTTIMFQYSFYIL